MYRTKTKDGSGPFKTVEGELTDNGEDVSKALNEDFISEFQKRKESNFDTRSGSDISEAGKRKDTDVTLREERIEDVL